MNKHSNSKGLVKSLSLVLLSGVFATTLSSCSKSKDLYNDINGDSTYLTLGDYSVANKEVYDELRYSSTDYLNEKITETVLKTYVEKVKEAVENTNNENHSKYLENVQNYLICDVFKVDTIDAYGDINNPYIIKTDIAQYIDDMYVSHQITITKDDVNTLIARTEDDKCALVYASLSSTCKNVLKEYYESYAKKLFAYDYLNNAIKENDEDLKSGQERYYSDSEIKNYWEENYLYEEETKAVLIRFINEAEVKEVFKTFGLKVYRSKLYFIKQNGVKKSTSSTGDETVNLTNTEYSSWYDDFSFSNELAYNSANCIPVSTDPNMMFALYLEMYNYVYSYRQSLDVNLIDYDSLPGNNTSNRRDTTQAIINTYSLHAGEQAYNYETSYNTYLANNEHLNYDGEKLADISSSLRSYIYNTLDFDSDDSNYSIEGQSYGDYYYMVFKIKDAEEETKLYYVDDNEKDELYYVLKKADGTFGVYRYDGSDSTEITDSALLEEIGLNTTEAKEAYYNLLNDIYEGLKDDELTSTYISTALTTATADVKVKIYDEIVEIGYMSKNENYSRTHGSAPEYNVIAKLTYEDEDLGIAKTTVNVTANDLWENVEPDNGYSVAVNNLTKKVIKDSDAYKDILNDKEKVDVYYDNLTALLTNFAQDGLSSYGYKSSLGKHNFLLAYFHSSDIETIINDYYCVNAASAMIVNDYSSTVLAGFMQEHANAYYDKYFSVSASNLMVTVDMNEDGKADRLGIMSSNDEKFDWTTVDANSGQTYSDLAQELIKKIILIVENSTSSDVDTINSIISEFNSASRFENGYNSAIDEEGNYNPTEAEREWAKYRRAGLCIKLGSDITVTNETTYADCYDVLKLALYKAYTTDLIFGDDVLPNEYILSSYYTADGAKGLLTDEGYNLLVITSATTKSSAEFTDEDDLNEIYQNLIYMLNDEFYSVSDIFSLVDADGKFTDKLSLNQVRAYLLEYSATGACSSLPTDVTTALTTYLAPIYTRYTSTATQYELVLQFLVNNRYKNANDSRYTTDGTKAAYLFYNWGSDSSSVTTERFKYILDAQERAADNYKLSESVYDGTKYNLPTFMDDEANIELLYQIENFYENWWTDLADLILELSQEAK